MGYAGPFDFPKLHGCLPDRCRCPGKNKGTFRALHADFYLKPMLREIRKMTGKTVRVVDKF